MTIGGPRLEKVGNRCVKPFMKGVSEGNDLTCVGSFLLSSNPLHFIVNLV